MGNWFAGKMGWAPTSTHVCPVRMFEDLYFQPWASFAGPSPDGLTLWTFDEISLELQQWDVADLSLLATLTPSVDIIHTSVSANLAIGPGFVYFIEEDTPTGDTYIGRASLSTGVATRLYSLPYPPEGMSYCHVDDGLYVTTGDLDLVRYEPDGSGSTTFVSYVPLAMSAPVWTTSHVWVLRYDNSVPYAEMVRVRISDGDVAVFPATGGPSGSHPLHSNGSVIGRYEAFIDPPALPDVDNWYFQYAESGAETIINNNIRGLFFTPPAGPEMYQLAAPNGGGCPLFVFSGETVGGASLSSRPLWGKQDASGTSWFVSDYGTYGALWRFQ